MASNEQRLTSIERRLTNIEKSLNIPKEEAAPAAVKKSPAAAIASAPAKPGNWLGIIAVICFVLAAGFIIKLSITSGWLTPERQIGLALVLGIALIGTGLSLVRADREYASLLPAAGVIVLYLTVFAAHRVYNLVPFNLAIGGTGLVSGLCIWLCTRLRHDIYAITAAVGAYTAPVVLYMGANTVFSLYYFLFSSVAFAVISIGVRSRVLTLVASYFAILMTGLVGADLQEDRLIAIMLPLHFAVFSVGTYLYSMQSRKTLTQAEANCFLPVLLIFYAMEYHFINRFAPELAPWISLGFAGALIALYLLAKQWAEGENLASGSIILTFATIAVFHSGYLELLPPGDAPWLLLVILIGIAISPLSLSSNKGEVSDGHMLPLIGVCAVFGIEYLCLVGDLLKGNSSLPVLFAAAVFASLWILFVSEENKSGRSTFSGKVILALAHLLAIIGLFRLTEGVGSLAISASWLFYGVAVILFAFIRKDDVMAKSALMVLGFAAGKALLYDAASAPTVIRILCLLLTGAVLYGTGLMIRRIGNWKN